MKKRGMKRLCLQRETVMNLGAVAGGRARGTADFETCEGCDSYYDKCVKEDQAPAPAPAPPKDVLAAY